MISVSVHANCAENWPQNYAIPRCQVLYQYRTLQLPVIPSAQQDPTVPLAQDPISPYVSSQGCFTRTAVTFLKTFAVLPRAKISPQIASIEAGIDVCTQEEPNSLIGVSEFYLLA